MEYRIETLEDFLKVPVDRRAACLAEFEAALRVTDEVLAQLPGLEVASGAFTWIDDGKRTASVRINEVPVFHTEDHSPEGS